MQPLSRRQMIAGSLAGAAGSALVGCRASGTDAAASSASEAAARAPSSPQPRDELDELFADLTDQRGTIAPIDREERAARRQRLGRLLVAQHQDALLVEPGPTMTYLSGVRWGRSERLFALLVLADGSHFWLAPAFEEPKARLRIERELGQAGTIVAWQEHEYAFAPLAAALRERRIERLAIEPSARQFVGHRAAEAFGRERVSSGASLVRSLRAVKDQHELDLLRRANELTQRALRAVGERLRTGLSARELGQWMRRAQERLGLSDVWVLPLVDAAAAFPHGEHGDERIEAGSVVLVDTGGGLHDYQSDMTRTWVHGAAPAADVERAWITVRDAQRRAFEAIRPGVPCREIDAAARGVIERAGYGAGYTSFTHRLGHGIGLEGHEEPYFDGGSEVLLMPGMTLSDEPGIYLLGRFGVRIEDIVAVTASGADVFSEWQEHCRAP